MKTLGPVILLFALLLSAFAQADAQDSIITFYTTDTAGPDSAPIVYSNGQKIGEVLKGQFIRLSVRPGTYQFALTEDAPPTEQLSISIGDGQKIFLRVTQAAFFIGRAAEANASLRTVTPSAAPAAVHQVTVPAVARPDLRAQSAQVKHSVSSQGIPGVLRCTFSATLSLHATIQPGSPVVAGVRCGDPVFLIDQSLASTHVRTQDGKDGFILGLNLGQWFIQTESPERASARVASSVLPSATTLVLPTAAVPDPPLVTILPASPASSLLAILAPVFPSAPPPEPISASAPVPAATMVHIIGRVAKPGAYPLNRPLTVMELLVRAGGFAEFAEQDSVIIVRYEGTTASRILFNYKTFVSGESVEQNILLRDRDLIVVP